MATAFEPLEGKYEILEKIREGGMGSVYKVRHRLLDELRVVKVMRPQLADDETLRARFLREAKVAIRLRHPNLAQIYDFTVDDNGYAYLVMEFIDGLNLEEVIKVLGRPALGLILEIADQSLDAIGYLHKKRIIHRDISPDNLLVTRDEDGRLLVKLIDLGIAKDREVEDSLTSAGTFLGKVRYSSPEHFRTHEGASVGVRSDLYSFGVVLYEMLTGCYPIRGSSVAALISGHLMHPPVPFEESDPEGTIPEPLRSAVLTSLAKSADERFDSAASFRAALAPIRAEHSVTDAETAAIFEIPTITTRRIPVVKPGSTQSRMDRSFKMQTTPPPGDLDDAEADLESSGTVDTGGKGPGKAAEPAPNTEPQVRALLLGAGKLIEGKHFDEARLQLASVMALSSDHPEAVRLLREIESADRKMQQRRQRAADSIRQEIHAERFERAETELDKARAGLGPAEIFEQLAGEVADARTRRDERIARLQEIDHEVATAIANDSFERAVELLEEAGRLDPGSPAIAARLAEAESARRARIEAERRSHEIEETAAAIAAHIERKRADEAARELAMAVKVYGRHESFEALGARIDELRARLLREEAEAHCGRAAQLLEGADFEAAIEILEHAAGLAPGLPAVDELLARAREGQRLVAEAQRRREAVAEATVRIERLLAAGRTESAGLAIEAAVEELGDFDEAEMLRRRVDEELTRLETSQASVTRALETALARSADNDFADAEEALDEARELVAGAPEMAPALGETEREVRRRIDAHRRQMAIDEVVHSVGRQLEAGATAEARRELAVAQRLYGDLDLLHELSAQIDSRERELRRQEIDDTLAAALDPGRVPDEVAAELEAALELDPLHERAHRLLADVTAALRLRREDDAAARAADAMAEVDRRIAAGDERRALELLDRATAEHGDFPAARRLRHLLGRGSTQRR